MQIEVNILPKNPRHTAISHKWFRLDEDFEAAWQVADWHNGVGLVWNEKTVTIMSGFQWDGATIPQWTWSFVGLYPVGQLTAPSLVHDYIYIGKGKIDGQIISRLECDKLFLAHMLHVGIAPKKAKKLYNIIRLFGCFYWCDNWIFNKIHKRN